MKKIIIAVCMMIVTAATMQVSAATYNASTLHNAVSRSETVQDLFFKRWEIIKEKELYVDFYGKLNWISGFKVKSYNSGNDQYESIDMTLVRTYGSLSLLYPVFGGYSRQLVKERSSRGLSYTKEEKDGEDGKEEKGKGMFGLWKPKNLIVGFTATGFHYGLTRKAEIDRGDAGTDTISDYKYSQFFDDIFAVSLLYRPYFYIHSGVVLSREIAPKEDGTMEYFDSDSQDNHSERVFINSNLFSFLNLNATTTSDKFESLDIGLEVHNLLKLLMGPSKWPKDYPQVTFSYKQWNYFNDEAYEGVWVKTYFNKTDAMSDDEKDNAVLHKISMKVHYDISNRWILDFFINMQIPSETLVEKRTNKELNYTRISEYYFTVGYNLFSRNKDVDLIISAGISSFWDVGVPIHSNNDVGYALFGGFFGIDFNTKYFGINIKSSYNHSPELRKLIEAADKFMLDPSIYARF